MHHYEMIIIVHPNVPEDDLSPIIDKVSTLIKQQRGEIFKVDPWGKRKFAHKIDKCQKGYYYVVYFAVNPAFLAEIEKTIRYDEKILRCQTVKIEKEKIEAPGVKDDAPTQGDAVPAGEANAADL